MMHNIEICLYLVVHISLTPDSCKLFFFFTRLPQKGSIEKISLISIYKLVCKLFAVLKCILWSANDHQ